MFQATGAEGLAGNFGISETCQAPLELTEMLSVWCSADWMQSDVAISEHPSRLS